MNVITAPEVRERGSAPAGAGDLVPVPARCERARRALTRLDQRRVPRGSSRGRRFPPVPSTPGPERSGCAPPRTSRTPRSSPAAGPREDARRPAHPPDAGPPRLRPVVLALAALALWLWHGAGWPRRSTSRWRSSWSPAPAPSGSPSLSLRSSPSPGSAAGPAVVRNRDLLEPRVGIRRVLFDKTGTLTMGRMVLTDPAALETPRPRRTVTRSTTWPPGATTRSAALSRRSSLPSAPTSRPARG